MPDGLEMNGGKIALPITSKTKLNAFTQDFISPVIYCHQGIATDGTYYYGIHTETLYKFDSNWDIVLQKNNAELDTGVSHIGDGFVYNNILYCACENWDGTCGGQGTNSPRIAKWNTSDFSFIGYVDVSSYMSEIAGVCTDGTYVYAVSYCNSNTIYKFNLSDLSYVGTITLANNHVNMQGITTKNGYFYTSQNSGYVYKIKGDGSSETMVCTVPPLGEGIDYSTNELLVLDGTNWVVHGFSSSKFTYLTWFKTPYLPSTLGALSLTYMRVFSITGNTIALYYDKNNTRLTGRLTNDVGATPSDANRAYIPESLLKTNTWMFLGLKYDGKTTTCYLNGLPAGTQSNSTLGPLQDNFQMGMFIGSCDATGGLSGKTGESMLFNKPLADLDILNIFNKTRKPYGV